MVKNGTVFTDEDFRILESYKGLTEGLAEYLGPSYELVLHSLHNLDNSVIAIVNGHYTGRVVGSPVTDLALKMLHDIETNGGKDYISYTTSSRDNHLLRSTTIAIRGGQNKIIGLLCINLHLSSSMTSFLEHILGPTRETGNEMISEQFSDDIEHLLRVTLDPVKDAVMNDPTILPSNKNKEIIYRLYQKGIFGLKSSVSHVAEELEISKNTVYLHLRSLNGKTD